MIAELAAFNAAFGVVKEFVANGRDLSDCFGFIGQMTTAKEDQSTLAVCKHYHCWLSWTYWLLRCLCSS
jgi:hypothetical protein